MSPRPAKALRVVVTGATGFLGAHLVEELTRAGHVVVGLARATSRTEAIERQGVEVVRASLLDPEALGPALEGADAVVHAAGGGIVKRLADVYRGNTESTRVLARVAAEAGVRTFVLVSSLAAHGPGLRAREEEVAAPRSHYGKSKRAAELAALREGEAHGMQVLALRPPALYGPGEHRMVDLFRAAQRGVVPMVHPEGTLSMLSGRDCARAIAAALRSPSAPSGAYFVSEREPYRRRAMAEAIGAAVGRPNVRVLAVPVPVLRTLGLVTQAAAWARGSAPLLGLDKVRDASAPHQSCDPRLAIATFDWEPEDDFHRGAVEAYRGYRARRWL